MSASISGLALLLVAGFLIQLPVYSRRLDMHLQTAARFPVIALLYGFGLNIAMRCLGMALPTVAHAGEWIAVHFGGFLLASESERLGTMYLSAVVAFPAGVSWALVEYLRTGRRIQFHQPSATSDDESVPEVGWMARPFRQFRRIRQQAELQISSEAIGAVHSLLVRAMREGAPVMLTLRSGKVYVGFIVDMGLPRLLNHPEAGARIFPVKSGYRDNKTRQVVLCTDYSLVLETIRESFYPEGVAEVEAVREADVSALKAMLNSIGQHFRLSEVEIATMHDENLATWFREADAVGGAGNERAHSPASSPESGAGGQGVQGAAMDACAR